MSLNIVKTSVASAIEIFIKIYNVVTGGFTLFVTPLTTGDTIKAGTIMGYDESTRIAKVVKQAILYEAEADSETGYKVLKGHQFKVGEFIALVTSGIAYAITAITTTETTYDTITVGTTLGVAGAAGDVMFEAAAEATSNTSAFLVTPKGILKNDVVVATNVEVNLVTRGIVYARRLPTGAHSTVRTALKLIEFSESY